MQLQDLVKGNCDCSGGKKKVKSYFVGFAQKTIGLLYTTGKTNTLPISPHITFGQDLQSLTWAQGGLVRTAKDSGYLQVNFSWSLGNHRKLHKTCIKKSLLLISSYFFFIRKRDIVVTQSSSDQYALTSSYSAPLILTKTSSSSHQCLTPGSRDWRVL